MFGLNFKEAIDYALNQKVVLPDEYYGSLPIRSKATTLAGLASLSQIKFVVSQYNKTISEGASLADFKKLVRNGSISVNYPDYRLDTFFRTNLQTAYGFGRYSQQIRNRASRPYWMYDAVNDSRTRESHALLDNTVVESDDSFWSTHYPPLGFNCRCTVISLSERQARARGITNRIADVNADTGFDGNISLYDENINNLFEQTIGDVEFGMKNVSTSLSALRSTIEGIKARDTLQRALLNRNPLEGEARVQYTNVLDSLADTAPTITASEVRLVNDYIQFKSPTIVNFLKSKPTDLNSKAVVAWMESTYRRAETIAPNENKTLYTRMTQFNTKNLLQTFKQGSIINLLAPVSVTIDRDIAARQVSNVMVTIRNASGVGIDTLGAGATSLAAKQAKEVILVPGTKLKVDSVVTNAEDGNTNIILSVTKETSDGEF